MTAARARLLLLTIISASVAACAAGDATSSTRPMRVAAASHDDVVPDSIPNATCRSGYSMANGRCTGE